jgi:hypothetical protein
LDDENIEIARGNFHKEFFKRKMQKAILCVALHYLIGISQITLMNWGFLRKG